MKEMALIMKEWGQRHRDLWVGSDKVENLESLRHSELPCQQNQAGICEEEPSRV